MKKRLLVAALIVAFVATGCGGKADDSATGSSTTIGAGSVTASSVPAADGVAGGADTGSSDSNACTRALAASTAFVLGVQLLASMNSPEAVVAVKSHTMGNLDLNQMEGFIADAEEAIGDKEAPLGDPQESLAFYRKAIEGARPLIEADSVTQSEIDAYREDLGVEKGFLSYQVPLNAALSEICPGA